MNYFEIYMSAITNKKRKKAIKILKRKGTLKKTKSVVDEKPEYKVGGGMDDKGKGTKKAVSVK